MQASESISGKQDIWRLLWRLAAALVTCLTLETIEYFGCTSQDWGTAELSVLKRPRVLTYLSSDLDISFKRYPLTELGRCKGTRLINKFA